MFNKRNLASIKNRKSDEKKEEEGVTADDEAELNPQGGVKLFKKRQIAKINITGNKSKNVDKKDVVPLESTIVDLQSSEEPINRATSTYEIDTDKSMDTRSILERNLEIGKKILAGELEDKVYRGRGAYKPVMNVREDSIAAAKYTGLYGPVRASATNVRTTLRIDYQPDICKDYKETGYCGFGDTCKFLHDRSDYKSGWQLEKEWEQQQAEKRQKMQKKLERWHRRMESKASEDEEDEDAESSDSDSNSDDSDSDSDSDSSESGVDEADASLKKIIKLRARKLKVPFCCLSCKKLWTAEMNPVVTSCNHYFCERCVIEAYSNDLKCPKCDVVTDGIMNRASAIEKLLESISKS
ncbi:complexed with cef1p [Theileria orientalis strain Shintoku]|uniref:Complexed with cef1p n=1 Tax=Theileria orientalis strain Shintoku TaxID=869250 RepID=J4DNP3_THEOR|nr:complexed with cef1p [Theileria orientalis strain Shintoku]PVC51948.1 complexed with cef1p [Theileria orientalis]BAM39309.1 complexed with cef1p [Theileria orientalis strain Shintoku]|eukprot:XP_009689610.1 complexed with cef1p [Theileria orientalis strain Shintoku]